MYLFYEFHLVVWVHERLLKFELYFYFKNLRIDKYA